MATQATILYDAPGPKGIRLNRVLTVATVITALVVALLVVLKLSGNGQFDAEIWTPFLTLEMWTTYILPGLWGTVSAAVVSIALALVIGGALGLGRISHKRFVSVFCGGVVELFRSIPVLLLMIFSYQVFAFYKLIPTSLLSFSAVVFGLTMYNGSVVAEILRSGIKALPKGQEEAAQALGMSRAQTVLRILLPQAIASMLPALISQMIIALKDSALGYLIGYVEVVRSGLQAASWYRNYLAEMVVVAIIMVLLNYGLSMLAERIEWQLRAGRTRRSIVAVVPHQKDVGANQKQQTKTEVISLYELSELDE